MNNKECRTRTKIININNSEPVFYSFSINVNKCSGSCNNINDSYAKLCVPDVAKNINVKVFHLMSWSNQTRHIQWHETCKCKCRLDASVCNNKQTWNEDKCRCERREELIYKGRCNKRSVFNSSNCGCECDRLCVTGEYLDYENCKCRQRIAGALVEKCTQNIDENEMAYNGTLDAISLNAVPLNAISLNGLNDYKKLCGSCTLDIVLFAVFLVTSTVFSTVFIYFYWFIGIQKKYYQYLANINDNFRKN